MINKLTGEPVSAEMQSVLKRLAASESVPEAEIMALKEIKEANSCISSSKPTIELKDRAGIQEGVFDRLQNMGSAVTKSDGAVSFSGEIRCERRMDIVIGLPASGKSSALVEPISEMYKSRVIDSDEAKKLLPEYNDGWGAGIVHKESQRISEQQLIAALEKGENITYPRVGGDATELINIAAIAKSKGYSVYVHFNELDRNKALGRMINRFLETGRYIKPELITRYGNDINNTYEQAKKATSIVDGFSKWSNDVPLGSRPKLIEYSGSCEDIVRAFKPKQLKPLGMMVVLENLWDKIVRNRERGIRTRIYIDEIYLLFRNEESANFLFELYKRARKWGGIPTGITQNVEDLLKSDTARSMLSNSEFILMLNQAASDRDKLAHLLKIPENMMNFVTGAPAGSGLIYCGLNGSLPFKDDFPTDTKLYKLMTTKFGE